MQFGKIMLTINYAKQMDNIKVQIGFFFLMQNLLWCSLLAYYD